MPEPYPTSKCSSWRRMTWKSPTRLSFMWAVTIFRVRRGASWKSRTPRSTYAIPSWACCTHPEKVRHHYIIQTHRNSKSISWIGWSSSFRPKNTPPPTIPSYSSWSRSEFIFILCIKFNTNLNRQRIPLKPRLPLWCPLPTNSRPCCSRNYLTCTSWNPNRMHQPSTAQMQMTPSGLRCCKWPNCNTTNPTAKWSRSIQCWVLLYHKLDHTVQERYHMNNDVTQSYDFHKKVVYMKTYNSSLEAAHHAR